MRQKKARRLSQQPLAQASAANDLTHGSIKCYYINIGLISKKWYHHYYDYMVSFMTQPETLSYTRSELTSEALKYNEGNLTTNKYSVLWLDHEQAEVRMIGTSSIELKFQKK